MGKNEKEMWGVAQEGRLLISRFEIQPCVGVRDYVNGLRARPGEVRRIRKSTEEFGRGSGQAGLGFSL
jgi:hypothetical protein